MEEATIERGGSGEGTQKEEESLLGSEEEAKGRERLERVGGSPKRGKSIQKA
jgi:hypothetical protein